MELWREVRRQVLVENVSKRAVCQKYGLGWQTVRRLFQRLRDEPPSQQAEAVARRERNYCST